MRYPKSGGRGFVCRLAVLVALTVPMPIAAQPGARDTAFVPTDSWIYAALDRLAALGFVPSQIAGIRPWSRLECRRQLRQAKAILERREDVSAEVASGIVEELDRELSPPPARLAVESVYLRNGVLSGDFLNDSFHFGQTWRNDYGRPFGEGWNGIAGSTGRAGWGPLFGEWRLEFQSAPGRAPYPGSVRELLAALDDNPVAAPDPRPDENRLRLVEGAVGVRGRHFSVSLGRQSLYWGPAEQAPLSFSNNAEPPLHLRVESDPMRLPGWFRYLGTVRAAFVVGKLGGHSYTWRPWFNAQKVSFKLSDNLEFGFTRWSLFFGVGHPITWGNLFRNMLSVSSGPSVPFDPNDPGDRKAGFDFRWRIPGVRDWLTLYADSYSEDDPSPLAAPRRAAISPGLWLTRVPWVPRLDLRVEAASTTPLGADSGGQFLYYNNQYHSGNTNYGFLLGNPVGRDGRAIEARANYWLSARDRLWAGFRQAKISGLFLPGGGTQSDASAGAVLRLRQDWIVSATAQYERFRIPVLSGPRHNWTGQLQLTWQPDGGFAWTSPERGDRPGGAGD